jgi:hypothetical protein
MKRVLLTILSGMIFSLTFADVYAHDLISGSEEKILNGAGNMGNENNALICPACGASVPLKSKFCPECGQLLSDNISQNVSLPESSVKSPDPDTVVHVMPLNPDKDDQKKIPPGPSDAGLKLLIDCCRKVIATGAGDSHNETVLYLDEKTGEYQIHTYFLDFGYTREYHKGFKTDKKTYEEVMNLVHRLGLLKYENKKAEQMTGAEYVCKFFHEGRIVRISTSNVPYSKHHKLTEVRKFLNSFIDKSREIKPEQENESGQ